MKVDPLILVHVLTSQQSAVASMCECTHYRDFLLGLNETVGGDLDQWIRGLWSTHLGEVKQLTPPNI